MGPNKYALRVLEGKLKGHIYDLPENSELFLGRGASLDIVIDEDMVSRRHAKILTFHDQIVLQDLESTNGTSVNQQRVQGSQRLQLGDSLTVGTCILELISAPQQAGYNQAANFGQPNPNLPAGNALNNGSVDPFPAAPTNNHYGNPMQANPMQANPMQANPMQANPMQANPMQANPMQANPMQNNFGSFSPNNTPSAFNQSMNASASPQMPPNFAGMPSLNGARPRPKAIVGTFPSTDAPDVSMMIERLLERRHDGILALFDPEEREGSVYFRGGRIYFATYEDPHRVLEVHTPPHEALVKLCCWPQGRFKVKTMTALPSFEQEINEESRSLLDRVKQTCIEMNQLRAQLPSLSHRLTLTQPLTPLLTSLNQEQLYLLQLAINQYEVRAIIDCHPQGEREGIKSLLFLLEQGYLQA